MYTEDISIKLSDRESVEATTMATDVITAGLRDKGLYLCVHHTTASTSVYA